MRVIKPFGFGYAAIVDVLYISFGPYDLTCLGHAEEVGAHMEVQYLPGGTLAGMEIYDFREVFGDQRRIEVDAEDPFILDLTECDIRESHPTAA